MNKPIQVKEKDAYTQAERVVEGVLSGKLKDNTNSSSTFIQYVLNLNGLVVYLTQQRLVAIVFTR